MVFGSRLRYFAACVRPMPPTSPPTNNASARGRLRVEGESGWASDLGVEHKRLTLDHLAEQYLEAPVVDVVFVNRLALVTPADDMV